MHEMSPTAIRGIQTENDLQDRGQMKRKNSIMTHTPQPVFPRSAGARGRTWPTRRDRG